MVKVSYSYNDIKREFEDIRESWMPAKLPLFKTITSSGFNADTKLYSGKEYTSILNFFEGKRAFNPICTCKRVNCFDINLGLSHDLHLYAETKQEYTKKVVRILKKWQEHARAFRLLNQTELSQLSRVIKLWEEKNPFESQEKAVREHWNKTVFNNFQPFSDVCLDVVDKLKKEIKEGRITDDKNQPDNPDALCGDCSQRYQAAQEWEKNYRQAIKTNCSRGSHYPIGNVQETKIHNKCWKIVDKNSHNDFQPCGCLNVKSSDLLEITSENLVKSFFVICEIGSIKKQPQSIFSIHYLNGRIKLVNSNQDCKLYEDLVTYFQPLPNYKIVTRKDLGLKEQDNPDDHTDWEKVRLEILTYFTEHRIENVRLQGDKLLVKYADAEEEEEEEEEANSPELQQIQVYCRKNFLTSLSLNDLKKGNDSQGSGYGKLLFYGGIAAVVICVVGLIAYFVYRSEKNRSRY